MGYIVGLGITDACNLSCRHCYSRPAKNKFLSLSDIASLCNRLDIDSVNLGTGESGLHPEFKQIVRYLYERNIDISLTTNGFTVKLMQDDELKMLHDVDFSLDFAEEKAHDMWRGDGNFRDVIKGIERCLSNRVTVSIVTTMMKANYDEMPRTLKLAKSYGIPLRINIYKPVHDRSLKLSPVEFWSSVEALLSPGRLVSCSEPIINALLRNRSSGSGSPCGKQSLKIDAQGYIYPCVYWNKPTSHLSMLQTEKIRGIQNEHLRLTHVIPKFCLSCDVLDICQGGCAARRLYGDGLENPDEFCFKREGVPYPEISQVEYEVGKAEDFIHSGYLCTIIIRGKG